MLLLTDWTVCRFTNQAVFLVGARVGSSCTVGDRRFMNMYTAKQQCLDTFRNCLFVRTSSLYSNKVCAVSE